jgi:hypothetical protein
MKSLVVIIACLAYGGPPLANDPLPWLHGFASTANSESETPGVSDTLELLLGAGNEAEYGGLQVTADVAPAAGVESVLASYRQGVVIVDGAGEVLARVPGFEPSGSADDLVALSVGDAEIGSPVIALAVNRGGHRESVTSVLLYRVDHGRLEQLFEGEVEDHDGSETSAGEITFLPNGLVYRAPHARILTVWTFDPQHGRYVECGTIAPEPAAGTSE